MLICVRRKVKKFKVNYLKRMTNQTIFFQLLCVWLAFIDAAVLFSLYFIITLHMHISVAFRYEANKGNLQVKETLHLYTCS